MEMLVTKFSNGKYRNEGDLFNEPISAENVKLMGEMIALQALRTVKKFDMKIADKLYICLIKDLHHMGEIDYIVSDGYDVAQTAICFLYQYVGRKVSEIYGKDRKGKDITIKLACYREVDSFINLLRNRPDRRGTLPAAAAAGRALPAAPVRPFCSALRGKGAGRPLPAAGARRAVSRLRSPRILRRGRAATVYPAWCGLSPIWKGCGWICRSKPSQSKEDPIGSGYLTTSAALKPLVICLYITCGLCLASAAIYPLAIARYLERAHFAMDWGDRRSSNTQVLQ